MKEEFEALKEERKERRAALSESRIFNAKKVLELFGCDVEYQCADSIMVFYKGIKIHFFPYTGWFQGKGMRGRGIGNLIKNLKALK